MKDKIYFKLDSTESQNITFFVNNIFKFVSF